MKDHHQGTDTVIKLLFRLLPVQILLAAAGTVNGLISGFFASNFIGVTAMSAVGVYSPISRFIVAIGTLLSGGSAILCGKYMGRNEQEKVRKLFSLVLLLAGSVGVLSVLTFIPLALLDRTALFTRDETVRPLFNAYLIGQAIGDIPYLIGTQLSVFLALENKQRLSLAASIVYIGVNFALQLLFIPVLHMGTFGLSLASSLGLWAFFGVQFSWFVSGRSKLRLQPGRISLRGTAELVKTGFPGAASGGYQTLCELIVINLLEVFAGSVAISAFATANNVVGVFWAVPRGMLAVSRLMIGVSAGEEDRQTLTDVMRNMMRRFVPLMCGVSLIIILLAHPLTRIFYRDPSEPVYMMTVWGFRLIPLCMPLSVICMHFVCYCQSIDRQMLVHILAALDGVVCVAGFSALLIPGMGVNGLYTAVILNGVVCLLVIAGCAWIKLRRPARNVEELMALPADFGVGSDEWIDITVQSLDGVLTVSRQVGEFCAKHSVDGRTGYMASLCLEEMAGNIVAHGFEKDDKPHRIDIRVVHKADELIMRIRDDCVPFDPEERNKLTDSADRVRNMGIRMAYKAARQVEYQSLLGLNVLTMRL